MTKSEKIQGWLSLSPLAVFLAVYLVSSLAAGDFYKVPVSAAFLVSSVYALCISRGTFEERLSAFSSGAGDSNVLLMIWIFVLAGAFASTAGKIGAIEATVNLTMLIVPDRLLLAGLFLASCFVSMSIGTSVGTIAALVPISSALASQLGVQPAMMTAIIMGGAFFGDNLSFISDTTIAATRTQGCSMSDKFKVNIMIAGPAAVLTAGVYLVMGLGLGAAPEAGRVEWVKLIPYIAVMGLALRGVNVAVALCVGLALNLVIGLMWGDMGWLDFLGSAGDGIAGMGDLIIVTLLAGGMLSLIRRGGGFEFMMKGLTSHIKGKRGAEGGIAALVGFSNLCTANNTIAIITAGGVSKSISERFSLDPRKVASILDTFSCIVQCVIPYGAQMLMASALSGVSPASVIGHLYYPAVLLVIAVLAIAFRFPRRYS